MPKKPRLVWFKKLQGMRQIALLKKQRFLSFTFYKTQSSFQKIMCVYFLFRWFRGETCMFLHSLHKGRQTSKEFKKETWMMELSFFWCLYLSSFLLKKRLWHRCFLWILRIFQERFFNRIPLGGYFWLLTDANLKNLY